MINSSLGEYQFNRRTDEQGMINFHRTDSPISKKRERKNFNTNLFTCRPMKIDHSLFICSSVELVNPDPG